MEPTVTARAFIGFAKMIREDQGPARWDELRETMRPEEQRIFNRRINSVLYLPYASYLTMIELLQSEYGGGEAAFHRIGQRGAKVDFATTFNLFANGKPAEFIANADFFWSNYYRGLGTLQVLELDDSHSKVQIVDGDAVQREHVLVAAGWMQAILEMMVGTRGEGRITGGNGAFGFDLAW